MDAVNSTRLDAAALAALAGKANTPAPCASCSPLKSPGWESMPSTFDRRALVKVGTLRDAAEEEPTLQEHHPLGTHAWSPQAPIALAFFPYNRCDVWQCPVCSRVYLRYTEYGGYYEDERVRQVDPALIVQAGPG